MHRTQILLEDWQYEALKALAAHKRCSISELLRALLTQYLRGESGRHGRSIAEIEGLGDDPEASGREHDRFLYGLRRPP